jgi:DNA-binding XRE family transcriptional regulator
MEDIDTANLREKASTFKDLLKMHRKELHLSQEQLVKKIELLHAQKKVPTTISLQTISAHEQGRHRYPNDIIIESYIVALEMQDEAAIHAFRYAAARPSAREVLLERGYHPIYGFDGNDTSTSNEGGIAKISDVLERLQNGKLGKEIKIKPMEITIEGILYPQSLLSSGAYTLHGRGDLETKLVKAEYKSGDLRNWLTGGWTEWAPSWSATYGRPEEISNYVCVQLGYGDEACSITTLVDSKIAAKLCLDDMFLNAGEALKLQGMPNIYGGIKVRVTGQLAHRRYFPDATQYIIGTNMDFVLRVLDGKENHGIALIADTELDSYSSYIWKALVSKKYRSSIETIPADEVWYIWEHVELTTRDALEYGIDSLEHKHSYVERKFLGDDAIVIQKSSNLVSGNIPEGMTPENFRKLMPKRRH